MCIFGMYVFMSIIYVCMSYTRQGIPLRKAFRGIVERSLKPQSLTLDPKTLKPETLKPQSLNPKP